jgi:hypothetical protein
MMIMPKQSSIFEMPALEQASWQRTNRKQNVPVVVGRVEIEINS